MYHAIWSSSIYVFIENKSFLPIYVFIEKIYILLVHNNIKQWEKNFLL